MICDNLSVLLSQGAIVFWVVFIFNVIWVSEIIYRCLMLKLVEQAQDHVKRGAVSADDFDMETGGTVGRGDGADSNARRRVVGPRFPDDSDGLEDPLLHRRTRDGPVPRRTERHVSADGRFRERRRSPRRRGGRVATARLVGHVVALDEYGMDEAEYESLPEAAYTPMPTSRHRARARPRSSRAGRPGAASALGHRRRPPPPACPASDGEGPRNGNDDGLHDARDRRDNASSAALDGNAGVQEDAESTPDMDASRMASVNEPSVTEPAAVQDAVLSQHEAGASPALEGGDNGLTAADSSDSSAGGNQCHEARR